ncbi:hypothetical protein HPP92_012164 [Vanilla planifolia]|uniref:Major facilitator superfamily domain-containing protein 12 n=1 Tax=Vanilla planifolia TaxID=51239 RepID=A0A835R9W1_VANPL|nr:hypothetical protein HPP92_012164 [Vanilla planifolia]
MVELSYLFPTNTNQRSKAIMVDAMNDEQSGEWISAEPLGRLAVLSYGAGHMLNDITSACWFTYLLLFLTDLGLSARDAAIVMLTGQVADAFTTIFAGELIDRFGHFKLWHAGGSVLVAISFSSVFGGCLPCEIMGSDSSVLQTIGYSLFAAIFNIGWAVTQVSHMSMVNCITLNPTSRVALASCRNAYSMVANLSLYAVALAVFSIYNAQAYAAIKLEYRWIAYLSILMGCFFVLLFLIGTKEPELKYKSLCENIPKVSWNYWFKKVLYYQVALVYILIRLITNVSQALLAFFVINDLDMPQSSKALVPAIIYISSFIISVILQEMSWTGSRLKTFFTIGAILWIFSGSGILFLPSRLRDIMYLLSITIGIANALMMVTGISMQSILVGKDLNGCGFVYGSLSFLDKLSCGLALYALESYQDSNHMVRSFAVSSGFSITRYGLGFIPAACALLSAVVIFTMDLEETRSNNLTEPLLV